VDLPLARSYDTIAQLTPLILENQGKGTMAGAVAIAGEPPQKIPLGNYVLTVSYVSSHVDPVPVPKDAPAPPPAPYRIPDRAGALFIAVGPDEYIAASSGPVTVRFLRTRRGIRSPASTPLKRARSWTAAGSPGAGSTATRATRINPCGSAAA